MAKPTGPTPISDDAIRALLLRYKCPVPFHEVRTRFLGNIATPVMSVSPIRIVQGLWGGELPPFDSIDEANELIGALVAGLWNRLTRHQDRSAPFRLTRIDSKPDRDGLAALALMRRQELDGFVQGLFGDAEAVDLPERAHRGVSQLAQLRGMFIAVLDAASDQGIVGSEKEMAKTIDHLRTMTRTAEAEIHVIVLACARARRQHLESMPATKPTLH